MARHEAIHPCTPPNKDRFVPRDDQGFVMARSRKPGHPHRIMARHLRPDHPHRVMAWHEAIHACTPPKMDRFAPRDEQGFVMARSWKPGHPHRIMARHLRPGHPHRIMARHEAIHACTPPNMDRFVPRDDQGFVMEMWEKIMAGKLGFLTFGASSLQLKTRHSTSKMPHAPMPPPMHMVTATRLAPRRLPSIRAWPVRR